ncbi:MAG: response regulator [Deltaproteobacteria bacterium]|jgi:putative two-component system response regulator|nr:response regulator [Deltaproteobacteria bacterium]
MQHEDEHGTGLPTPPDGCSGAGAQAPPGRDPGPAGPGEEETRSKVMIVDDDLTNLVFAKSALSADHDVYTAPSAARMFETIARGILPDLILLDISMPVMDGYQAIRLLKSDPSTRKVPVVFLTAFSSVQAEVDGLSLGAVDYIAKPFEPPLLRKRVELHLTMEAQKRLLEAQKSLLQDQKRQLEEFNSNLMRMVDEKTSRVVELQGAILTTVADLVECRDDFTGGHVNRTKNFLRILAGALSGTGLYRDEVIGWDLELLCRSSELHDVGKISVSDRILLKRGRLTPAEFEEIKLHTCYGVRIIDRMAQATNEGDYLRHAKIFAGTHHEKWDGTGYPDGLRGESIPLEGRLLAICDVYDALTSRRPYKEPLSHDTAVGIIMEGRGSHFDPCLADIFNEVSAKFRG